MIQFLNMCWVFIKISQSKLTQFALMLFDIGSLHLSDV